MDPTEPCDYSTVSLYNEEFNLLNIYPNPVSNTLNFTIEKGSNLNFIIYDLSNKNVLEGEVLNNQIDVSKLKGGTYMPIISNVNEGFRMSKFVKK